MLLVLILFLTLTNIDSFSSAERIPLENKCASPTTNVAMTECAAQKYRQADKALNASYKQLTQKLDAPAKAKLVKAETAWISFRDAQCDFEADQFRGGTNTGLSRVTCLTEITQQRTDALKRQIKGRQQ